MAELRDFWKETAEFFIQLGVLKFMPNHEGSHEMWRKVKGFSGNDDFLRFFGAVLCKTLNKEVKEEMPNSACALLSGSFSRLVCGDAKQQGFAVSFEQRK